MSVFGIVASTMASSGFLHVTGDGIPSGESGQTIQFGEIPYDVRVSLERPDSVSKHIAMFVIPVNYTTEGEWEQFELKATTNNFSHAVSEDERLQYYAQSEIADTGADKGDVYNCTFDKMWIFACTSFHGTGFDGDVRSFFYVGNTCPGTGWQHHITTAVVLVDTSCLKRHPGGGWLSSDNDDLMWVWHRYYYSGDGTVREKESGSNSSLWRPISPVRWFSELPSWAKTQIPVNR